MIHYIDHNGQLHLTTEKQDNFLELNPPTILFTAEQTDELRATLGVRKPDNPEPTNSMWGWIKKPRC